MYEIRYKGQFKKDLKRIKKRSVADFESVRKFVKLLQQSGFDGIPPKNKPHSLKGNFKGHYEAHIKPDLLIIWLEDNNTLTLELVRSGTHSDLF